MNAPVGSLRDIANGAGAGALSRLKPRRVTRRQLGLGVVALLAIGVGTAWWLTSRHYKSTDDAFIAGDSVNVAARLEGEVVRVLVDDNERVTRGQTLVELDPADREAAVEAGRPPWRPRGRGSPRRWPISS